MFTISSAAISQTCKKSFGKTLCIEIYFNLVAMRHRGISAFTGKRAIVSPVFAFRVSTPKLGDVPEVWRCVRAKSPRDR